MLPNHLLTPPRTNQDIKNIDFSLWDLQNSWIGSLFRWFFQIYKITYKSQLDKTWYLAPNHPLNADKSPSNPPRTKQDLKNIDFSLLDLQNSLIGSLIRWFFQIYKIASKSRYKTWFLALNHPLNAAKSPPNPPRTKQDIKNIDFSLLDLKNSLTGSLFRCFFQKYKITYKYHK